MMNRRAAVASMLLKKAGIQGGIGQIAMDLPPETLCQFDKVLGHGTPSRIPGQDEGIVVAYKSGDTVAKRPMKDIIANTGIMGLAEGGAVPSPKEKPRSPVGQELYGLGDVEFRADLEPYLSQVVDPRSTSRSSRPLERLEDDYVALMGLRALEQKYGGDYGKFIDADARRLDPSFTTDLSVRGDYNPETDEIRVKTTPTQQQSMDARRLKAEGSYRAYFDRSQGLSTLAHELFHAGTERIDPDLSIGVQHRALAPIDWERLRKTPEGHASSSVMQKTNFGRTEKFQPEKPFRYEDIRGLQAEARDLYEDMGPPRVKGYADGGEVEPRPTGRVTSDGRPVWDAGGEVYSELTTTLPYGDGWVVMPTVDVNGSIMSEDEVARLLDQLGPVDVVTGAELPVFGSLSEADRYAKERSAHLGRGLMADEPRSADPDAEILAIYDLLDKENRKPERKRDPERIEELYSRLTELEAMSPPPVALELSDDVYLRPQFDARFGIGESNRRVPFFEDTVQIRDRNMGGIGRLGAEIGFPGFSGNDRLSGGVTATYNRTKRLFPDEYVAFGAPSDIRFGPRGVVPVGYDVSYSSGPHTMSGRYEPRMEGAPRNMPGGRSVQTFGYSYQTPQETFSVEATPFGRNMVDPQTGEPLGMDRRIYARYSTSF